MKLQLLSALIFLTLITFAQSSENNRWKEKLCIDYLAQFIRVDTVCETTIQELNSINLKFIPGPKTIRQDIEFTVVRISGILKYKMLEMDGDIHLAFKDLNSNSYIITEIINPEFAKESQFYGYFKYVRDYYVNKNIKLNHVYTVYGILFIDKNHGQIHHSLNGIEIHPILFICPFKL